MSRVLFGTGVSSIINMSSNMTPIFKQEKHVYTIVTLKVEINIQEKARYTNNLKSKMRCRYKVELK